MRVKQNRPVHLCHRLSFNVAVANSDHQFSNPNQKGATPLTPVRPDGFPNWAARGAPYIAARKVKGDKKANSTGIACCRGTTRYIKREMMVGESGHGQKGKDERERREEKNRGRVATILELGLRSTPRKRERESPYYVHALPSTSVSRNTARRQI